MEVIFGIAQTGFVANAICISEETEAQITKDDAVVLERVLRAQRM